MDSISNTQQQQVQPAKILFLDSQKGFEVEIKKWMEKKNNNQANFETIFVSDVKSALDKLSQESFSLLVMDVALPIVNGYYLLDLLSRSSQTFPVIVYTRLTHEEDLRKISSYRIDNLFLKRLTDVNDLLEFICAGQYKAEVQGKTKDLLAQMQSIEDEEKERVSKFTQCPRCNLILSPKAHFCNNCGQKIFKKNAHLIQKESDSEVDSSQKVSDLNMSAAESDASKIEISSNETLSPENSKAENGSTRMEDVSNDFVATSSLEGGGDQVPPLENHSVENSLTKDAGLNEAHELQKSEVISS